MGKLFWKMFLGLWAGSALLMVGTALLLAMTIEQRIAKDVEDSLERYAGGATRGVLAVHEAGSKQATEALLTELENSHGLRIYLVDAQARDILGRTVPPGPKLLISPSPNPEDGCCGPPANAARMRLDFPITSRSGVRYRALVSFSPATKPTLDFATKGLEWPVIVSILIAGLVSALSARYLVKPISKLQAATQRLADGELDYRIAPALAARGDEFTALGNDFDRMADQIGNLLASQRQLMLDLSHELRSPLARMKVALELTRRQSGSHDLIDRMDRDADRMDSLIGELLLLARLESRLPTENLEVLDMSELISSIVEDARLESASSGHYIRALIAPGLAAVGHQELLYRAIENVVRNALKHTPPGGEIEIEASGKKETITIKISDTGPGVPEELIGDIFKPFARGEASPAGFGLGLAITRAAVEHHGGSVRLKNREGCSGLEITLYVPTRAHV